MEQLWHTPNISIKESYWAGLVKKKNTLLFTHSINRYIWYLALISHFCTVLTPLGHQIHSEPDEGIFCFSKCCNACSSETCTLTHTQLSIKPADNITTLAFAYSSVCPSLATQMSEKRVKQQAVTALAPGCLNHLPVSYQRLCSTSSTYPCSSCIECLHCENLLSASSAKQRYSCFLTG